MIYNTHKHLSVRNLPSRPSDRPSHAVPVGGTLLLLLLASLLLAVPVAASTGDVTVDPSFNMTRVWSEENHIYQYWYYYFMCNLDSYSNFDADVRWHFELWNDGSHDNSKATDPDYPIFTVHLSFNGQPGACTNSNNTLVFNDTIKYCCGLAQLKVLTSGADSNPDNNKRNDNNPSIKFLDGQTKTITGAILNWGGSTQTFDNTVDSPTVPAGWTAQIVSGYGSVQVTAHTTYYFQISVTAPSSISSYPEIMVWSKISGNALYDQSTKIKTKGTGTDDCE